MSAKGLRYVIVVVTSALVGLATALLVASLFERLGGSTLEVLAAGAAPGGVAALAAALALRFGRTSHAASFIFVPTFVVGIALVGLPVVLGRCSLQGVSTDVDTGELPSALFAGALLLAVLVSPFAVPVSAAARRLERPSRDAVGSAVTSCSIWAACAMIVSFFVIDAPAACAGQVLGAPRPVVLVPFLLFGFTAAVARLHDRHRRLWLERVRHGEVEGWRVVGRREVGGGLAGVPPLFHGPDRRLDGVVARVESEAQRGAYRSAEKLVPWALVDLEESEETE